MATSALGQPCIEHKGALHAFPPCPPPPPDDNIRTVIESETPKIPKKTQRVLSSKISRVSIPKCILHYIRTVCSGVVVSQPSSSPFLKL